MHASYWSVVALIGLAGAAGATLLARSPRVVPVAAMSIARAAHQATPLGAGHVLVTGGCTTRGCDAPTAAVERFDPRARAFRTAAPMRTARVSHTAARLPDGRVLVAGGLTPDGPTASAEVYDPRADRWDAVAPMSTARASHVAVPLVDGRVLIMGGGSGRLGDLATAELFDPATSRFVRVGPMRANHYLATRLADGRVLLTGGQGADGAILRGAELFDPRTRAFVPTGDMVVPRVKHAAALLPDGRVLLVGGSDGRGFRGRFASTELYDPATGRFTAGPPMRWGRHKLRDAVVALPSGAVLVGGGAERPELWDPHDRTFVAVGGAIGGAQMFATATPLAGDDVLVAGGYDERIAPSAAAWVIGPRR
jgi:hypothetical protein